MAAAAQPADSGNGSGGGGAGWGMTGFGGGLGLGGGGGFGGGSSSGGGSNSGGPKGMSLAQRMLEKMGWKEGEGLGRNRQGMATPLMMQKTDVRSGVIVNAAPGQAANPAPAATPVAAGTGFGAAAGGEQPAKRQRSATFNRPPTRVVLLTNMVRTLWLGMAAGAAACCLHQQCVAGIASHPDVASSVAAAVIEFQLGCLPVSCSNGWTPRP
jgi:hypothetical protein